MYIIDYALPCKDNIQLHPRKLYLKKSIVVFDRCSCILGYCTHASYCRQNVAAFQDMYSTDNMPCGVSQMQSHPCLLKHMDCGSRKKQLHPQLQYRICTVNRILQVCKCSIFIAGFSRLGTMHYNARWMQGESQATVQHEICFKVQDIWIFFSSY